jgi:hypothetical protein
MYQARIAVCGDDACSAGPAISTFDDAENPRTTISSDGFLVWYRTGPGGELDGRGLDVTAVVEGWDLMVGECAGFRFGVGLGGSASDPGHP